MYVVPGVYVCAESFHHFTATNIDHRFPTIPCSCVHVETIVSEETVVLLEPNRKLNGIFPLSTVSLEMERPSSPRSPNARIDCAERNPNPIETISLGQASLWH